MQKRFIHLLLLVFLIVPLLEGCGDPITNRARNRGTFALRRWLRYEFRQIKTYSYGNSQVKDNIHVMGYEPSWLIYDSLYLNYPFELLSDLVVGEYDVNPLSGYPRNDSAYSAYDKKDILEVATATNGDINVLLAVTDYGDYGYRGEFLSEVAKKNLLNSLDQILDNFNRKRKGGAERSGVGVLMDYPNIPWNLRMDYAEFLARMKNDLDNEEVGKSCLVYAVLPPKDDYLIFRDSSFAATMRDNVDMFIVRGHVFDESIYEGNRGPMAPVNWPGKVMDLDSAINYYVYTARIPREKIIVEFPYYGKFFSNDSTPGMRSPLVPLNQIFNAVEAPREMDTLSMCMKRRVDTTTYFYEDTLSLHVKYSWVERQQLGGIGLYGLGYASGMDDQEIEDKLWFTIAEHFTEPAPRLLFPGIGYFLCFIGVGIITSAVMHWQVRFALRERRRKLWYYIGFLAVLTLAIILNVLPLEDVRVLWKLLSLVAVLVFPLGRQALKLLKFARR
ncbi:MAG: glycosyl hydrolase family 18 protein [Bacteroidota bacterium]